MARLRATSGQTFVEYLGVLVLVCLLVAGLVGAAPALGRAVGHRAICLVKEVGGEDCASRAPAGPGYRGPTMGDGVPVGLPFPGSLPISGDGKTDDGHA